MGSSDTRARLGMHASSTRRDADACGSTRERRAAARGATSAHRRASRCAVYAGDHAVAVRQLLAVLRLGLRLVAGVADRQSDDTRRRSRRRRPRRARCGCGAGRRRVRRTAAAAGTAGRAGPRATTTTGHQEDHPEHRQDGRRRRSAARPLPCRAPERRPGRRPRPSSTTPTNGERRLAARSPRRPASTATTSCREAIQAGTTAARRALSRPNAAMPSTCGQRTWNGPNQVSDLRLQQRHQRPGRARCRATTPTTAADGAEHDRRRPAPPGATAAASRRSPRSAPGVRDWRRAPTANAGPASSTTSISAITPISDQDRVDLRRSPVRPARTWAAAGRRRRVLDHVRARAPTAPIWFSARTCVPRDRARRRPARCVRAGRGRPAARPSVADDHGCGAYARVDSAMPTTASVAPSRSASSRVADGEPWPASAALTTTSSGAVGQPARGEPEQPLRRAGPQVDARSRSTSQRPDVGARRRPAACAARSPAARRRARARPGRPGTRLPAARRLAATPPLSGSAAWTPGRCAAAPSTRACGRPDPPVEALDRAHARGRLGDVGGDDGEHRERRP